MVRIKVRFEVRVRFRVRVRPFSRSREVRFWTRPHVACNGYFNLLARVGRPSKIFEYFTTLISSNNFKQWAIAASHESS